MKNKYRIFTDRFFGYEVQVKRWYFPFMWYQFEATNTHTSVKEAEEYFCRKLNCKKVEVVKELFEEQCE
jgi:hypothetical protein